MSPRSWISAWILAAQLGFAVAAAGPDFSADARLWRQQLGERVLPYWFDTAIDWTRGGYFWSVAPDGTVRDPRKRLYGEAFVIYGLVEFHRAGGGTEALADAL
jgi:mannose/cellobiose epimerase-like protein (N-acyl-D-glucosamine 2-epimerase family)